MANLHFNLKQIKQFPEHIQKQIWEQLNEQRVIAKNGMGGDNNPLPQPYEQTSLETKARAKAFVDYSNRSVFVRITRQALRPLDDDNFVGGCKELRDAIVTAIGKKGDSEADGVQFEYEQKKGNYKLIVEIYEIKED